MIFDFQHLHYADGKQNYLLVPFEFWWESGQIARKTSQIVSQIASRRLYRRDSGSKMGGADSTQLPSNRRKPFGVNWSTVAFGREVGRLPYGALRNTG